MKVRLIIMILSALSLTGCTTLTRDVVAPEIYLSGIQPLESGLLEQRMRVDLNIVNPNRHSVTITGMDFVLDVNDSRLLRGIASDKVTIPARGERILSVTARTGIVDVVRQLLKVPGTHTLKYRLTGGLQLGRFGSKTFPFDYEGEMSRDNLFRVAGGS